MTAAALPKKIGIVANTSKTGAHELLAKLTDWLTKRNVPVMDSTTQTVDAMMETCSLIICLGGDGTLLSVAGHFKEKSIPILGVNLGSLGFLTEVKQTEVFEELSDYLLDQYKTEDRLMLSCWARSDKHGIERRFVALNDMVISREGLTRLLHAEIGVSGEKLTAFRGDGVIISTPTGSTAYSLSAGGAVLHPRIEAMLITAICPHASALRSIAVGAGEKISVKIRTDRAEDKALLTADGQGNLEIDDSYTIEITRATHVLKLFKSSKRSYFATLRENFKFPE
jgi:NAD+ kinase